MNNKSNFILVVSPGKNLRLKYRKSNGEIKNYKVLTMESDVTHFLGYVYKSEENRPGIRRFNQEGILDIQEV